MALAKVFERVAGPVAPVEFHAYDGSKAGAENAPVKITVRSPTAVSYLAQAPGGLGLARAYVSGQLGGPRVLLPRVPPPPQEVRVKRRWVSGRRHSKARDASAISHHYDVSNTFYGWVLGPSMAYTCACFPSGDATLEQAQEYKFDLVARKLG